MDSDRRPGVLLAIVRGQRSALACLAFVCSAAAAVEATQVSGQVMVKTAPGIAAAPTVIYAEPLDRDAPSRPTTARLVQKDKSFVTPVVAVPVGSTVEFPNQDPIFHNVFSRSPPSPFDLGLYRAGASQKRVFGRPGTYRVFCNIHPQMTASIFVVSTPYVTTAATAGRFTLDLPAGRYRITARSDRAEPVTTEVVVGSTAVSVDLAIDESGYVAVPHKNKFGRDYPASAYAP